MDIRHCDGLKLLESIDDGAIDLILTDPPYIISHETGMNSLRNAIDSGEDLTKTEDEWTAYTSENPAALTTPHAKENYMKYGTIYGKKYSVKTNYGKWDEQFTMENLEQFIKSYYKKLRDGGTCIIFFDIWKLSYVKELMEKYKFKQIRFIEWVKTNPQPINSRVNYLTNAREIALLGVKKGKPTFNGEYDNGIYRYPIQGGKSRRHPTQKNLKLFEDIIQKHSNEGDLVVDTFLGGGTTAFAAKNTGRRFIGSELDETYYKNLLDESKTSGD
jgi:site-specific DNA-methyltransferase (adenine-specific)